ncbi:hypothetical protein C7N43_14200 [Sphingobacteriales bacterium UPWRP_1]|nr:hypothetical protein BVG80_11285 [Sphingobacteriales bacterium TSM_CSM]PSJ76364.1 hypothetical protein C7N43_14200 [Sphingobacteriales bacterium UPWRP_1]
MSAHFRFVHIAFTVVCCMVLPLPGMAIGAKLLLLTVFYQLAVVGVAFVKKQQLWQQLWWFYMPFGWFNIFPDWFLSAWLKVLYYPNEGIFKIGTIGGYMPFLWFIPMFMLTCITLETEKKHNHPVSLLVMLIAGMLVFGLSEHCFKLLGSWHAQNVNILLGNAAVYVLLSEAVLLISGYYLFKAVQHQPVWVKIPAAFALMLLYMGSLVFFYFVVEWLPAV